MAVTPCYWLFKSEPGDYSIDDFERDGETLWDGIRSWQVRNCFRDQMQPGERFVFYHSSCPQPAAVGIGEVAAAAVPDPLQFSQKSKYYDPASDRREPRWLAMPVKFVARAGSEYPLARMRTNRRLTSCRLLARGNRLSVLPLSPAHWREITRAMKLG
ncbi:MAG: EVE domain-containing protein [Betaproteobacteria bacterium]|nr:EVE domain-containing protein [Betaproteobacteria bacterium]